MVAMVVAVEQAVLPGLATRRPRAPTPKPEPLETPPQITEHQLADRVLMAYLLTADLLLQYLHFTRVSLVLLAHRLHPMNRL